MSEITIHVKFFGAFRRFGESLDFPVPAGSTIAAVKIELQKKLDGYGLVSDSVLANDNSILRDGEVIEHDAELSILPPVCGG